MAEYRYGIVRSQEEFEQRYEFFNQHHRLHCETSINKCNIKSPCFRGYITRTRDDMLIAMMTATPFGTQNFEIYDVCVHKDYRGRGLAGKLLDHFIENTTRRNYYLGIDIRKPDWKNIAKAYVRADFVPECVTDTMPSGLKPGFYFLYMSRVKIPTTTQLPWTPNRGTVYLQTAEIMVSQHQHQPEMFSQVLVEMKRDMWNKWYTSILELEFETSGIIGIIEDFGNSKYLGSSVDREPFKVITGTSSGVPTVQYYINWHSHPYICYKKNNCYIGWPSAPDVSHLVGQVDDYGLLAHLVFTLEGVYVMQLHPFWMQILYLSKQFFLKEFMSSCITALMEGVRKCIANVEHVREIRDPSALTGCAGDPYSFDCLTSDTTHRYQVIKQFLDGVATMSLKFVKANASDASRTIIETFQQELKIDDNLALVKIQYQSWKVLKSQESTSFMVEFYRRDNDPTIKNGKLPLVGTKEDQFYSEDIMDY